MSQEVEKYLELQKALVDAEKKRLGLVRDEQVQIKGPGEDNKENFETLSVTSCEVSARPTADQKVPLVDRLDLYGNESNLERSKQAFIDSLANSENPLSFRPDEAFAGAPMLRYGEYSPNNPQYRVAAAPYVGLGEYEQRKRLLLQQRRAEYKQYVADRKERVPGGCFLESRPVSAGLCKSVQTDIQNIRNKLVQYELHPQDRPEKDPNDAFRRPPTPLHPSVVTNSSSMEPNTSKPKSILSKRNRSPYVPGFLDGFSYRTPSDELEIERAKREAYQAELRQQIEENRRLAAMREEQERREREQENRRLERQLARMREEEEEERRRRRMREEQLRRNSEEEFTRQKQELRSRYWRHADQDGLGNTMSKSLTRCSPPISRREAFRTLPMESPSRYHTSLSSSRYDSLSRIDSLSGHMDSLSLATQRRHSATQQDLRRSPGPSPGTRRRSRLDDPLPAPVLKAHSPVARELRNSVAVDSSRSGGLDSYRDGGRSVLTQLGAMRMQLRQEQMRMDEDLRRRRGVSQSKAVDFKR